MKTAIKVFLILAMIAKFWMIVPLVFGIIALKKIKAGKPSTLFNVLVLIFCDPIAGILLLCSKPEAYN